MRGRINGWTAMRGRINGWIITWTAVRGRINGWIAMRGRIIYGVATITSENGKTVPIETYVCTLVNELLRVCPPPYICDFGSNETEGIG